MKKSTVYILLLFISILVGCSNEEENFEETFKPFKGSIFAPNIGGPNQPNQVYVDLVTSKEVSVKRDSWTIGFRNKEENFNVILNSSIFTAAAELEKTDIDAVTEEEVKALKKRVTVFTYDPADGKYVDDPYLNFDKNAIKPIQAKQELNKVYLINLGHEVPTRKQIGGSVGKEGKHIGWRKIRILRKYNGYLLQYAKLNEKTHKEIFIRKKNDYAFTYFDLKKEKVVSVAPRRTDWDICFTTFTYKFQKGKSKGMSYAFSDCILSNTLGGVTGYKVSETKDSILYKDFTKVNIKKSELKKRRTFPGTSWRNVFERDVIKDNFYIIKTTKGVIYKIKFLQIMNDKEERGNTKFTYEILK